MREGEPSPTLIDRYVEDFDEIADGHRYHGCVYKSQRHAAVGDDVRGLMILVVLTVSVAGIVFGVYLVLRAIIRPHHDRDGGLSAFGAGSDDAAGPYHHGEWGIHHGHHGGDNHLF